MLKVLLEGVEKLQFFQVAVVRAESEAEASEVLSRFLSKRGATLVKLDPEETCAVSKGDFPEAWFAQGEPGEGVLALSGRIWVDPAH